MHLPKSRVPDTLRSTFVRSRADQKLSTWEDANNADK